MCVYIKQQHEITTKLINRFERSSGPIVASSGNNNKLVFREAGAFLYQYDKELCCLFCEYLASDFC